MPVPGATSLRSAGGWLVTSIDRTAYPQFRRAVSVRELRETFTPADDEVAWAREKSRTENEILLTSRNQLSRVHQ